MTVSQERSENSLKSSAVRNSLFRDAVAGLRATPKALPPKYLYDDRGSQLFDDICELDEYYPTRTEMAIMQASIGEIASELGSRCVLIEPGSGSSLKTRLLLEELDDIEAYVPIDIAREHLERAVERLRSRYPELTIVPVCGDFTRRMELPLDGFDGTRRVVYFPGSTIGNLHKPEARDMLRNFADMSGRRGAVLIGVDLKKDVAVLERAYNDDQGVTAEFNLNLLHRMNRELGADFRIDRFRHQAVYNGDKGRVEMHLISKEPHEVQLDGTVIRFDKGESVLTECSYKYTPEEFAGLARSAGLEVRNVWLDDNALFSVQYLTAA